MVKQFTFSFKKNRRLGFKISKSGVALLIDNIKAKKDIPIPKNLN